MNKVSEEKIIMKYGNCFFRSRFDAYKHALSQGKKEGFVVIEKDSDGHFYHHTTEMPGNL